MKGFVDDIETLTEGNADFRRVLYTGKNLQLVLMAIQRGDAIGEEVHDDRDQFFRVLETIRPSEQFGIRLDGQQQEERVKRMQSRAIGQLAERRHGRRGVHERRFELIEVDLQRCEVRLDRGLRADESGIIGQFLTQRVDHVHGPLECVGRVGKAAHALEQIGLITESFRELVAIPRVRRGIGRPRIQQRDERHPAQR